MSIILVCEIEIEMPHKHLAEQKLIVNVVQTFINKIA